MSKNKRILSAAFVIAMLVFPWPIPEVVVAQGKASVPRPQDTLALGENAAKDLLTSDGAGQEREDLQGSMDEIHGKGV